MDGWMDTQMGGWMDGWMGGWMIDRDGWIGRQMPVSIPAAQGHRQTHLSIQDPQCLGLLPGNGQVLGS